MRFYVGLMVLLSIFLVSKAGAEEVQRPDFGGDGIFSYVPPDGWKVSEFPGLKYKISFGTPAKGFAPNIAVVDEASDRSLDDYAKDNITTMEKFFNGLKILSQSEFTTSDGARAIKLVTERDDDQSKKRLRQIYYLFDAATKTFLLTSKPS